jgi:iron complex transport system substrate-binding protein
LLSPRRLFAPLCLLLVLLLAACGASPTTNTATPTAPPTGASIAPTARGGASTATGAVPGAAGATGTPGGGATASRPGASATRPTGSPTRAATAGATAVVTAPRPQLPATVKDKDGRSVTVTDIGRIIVITGDVAETIWALGLGGNVIATDTSVTYPPEAQRAPKIGYMRTLTAEGIIAARPSVIIGGESAGPPAVLEQLRGAGIPVVIVATPPTLAAPAQKIREIGAALGVPGPAEALATRTQSDIDAARALAARAMSKPRVMFLNVRGNQVQQISGTGAPAQAIIEAAGGIDAGAAAGIGGYKPITPEALVAGQPDYYLLFQLGLDSVGGADGLLAIPGVAQTPAGQNRRILAYEDQLLLGLGPRTGQVLRELTLMLHPELR